jgi:hypothetical protein
MEDIGEMLKVNKTLQTLSLGNSCKVIIGWNMIDSAGLIPLARVMKDNTSLKELDLGNTLHNQSLQFHTSRRWKHY